MEIAVISSLLQRVQGPDSCLECVKIGVILMAGRPITSWLRGHYSWRVSQSSFDIFRDTDCSGLIG